jgi:hypothetical protein
MSPHPDHTHPTTDIEFQIARWRHEVDWWSGRIVPWVTDHGKAIFATERMMEWMNKRDA